MIEKSDQKQTDAKVLVTDGNQRSTLALVRSLGSRGVDVTVAEDSRSSLASRSRYCAQSLVCPAPAAQPTAFRKWLADQVAAGDYQLLIPMTDVTGQLVDIDRAALGRNIRIALPDPQALAAITDKGRLLEIADRLEIPYPRSYRIEDMSQAASVLEDAIFPLVVKPRRSAILMGDIWLKPPIEYCRSVEEVFRLLGHWEFSEPPLIQERVVGPGTGAFYLFDHGKKIASFFHRRLTEMPPSGGVSVLRESVPADATIDHHATRLLEHLGWHGVAMVEFKHDNQTGVPMLMEINARFWGSLQLAIDAGVDFPHLLYQLETSGSVRSAGDYRIGVKSRWFLGDLNHLIIRLFKSEAALNLPNNYPGRLATVWEFFKFRKHGMKHEVFRYDDLRPALFETVQYLKSMGSSLVMRLLPFNRSAGGQSETSGGTADKPGKIKAGDG